jgi:glycosyltransferase involved in cell wall biosynthesis
MKLGGTETMYGADENRTLTDFFGDHLILQYHRSFSDALKGLSKLKCDIVVEVYIHKRYYPKYLAFKKRNKKVVKFFTIFMTGADSSTKRWLRKTFRAMFCSTVFAVSPNLVDELKHDGVRAVWLPPPVPDCYFSASLRRPKHKVVISFLGRIDPNKGLYELSSVFDALSRSNQVTCRIRGYYIADDAKSVELHKRLGALAAVDYSAERHCSYHYDPGKEQDVLRYLSETDILVLPYKNLKKTLNLPLLVLEGLATECVVISRDVGAIRQIVGSAELIIRDFDELREKVQRFSSFEILQAERTRIKSLDLFSTFATTKVVDKLTRYF